MTDAPGRRSPLTIRAPQVLALSSAWDSTALRTELARRFPHRFAGADALELRDFVDATVALALAHGITRTRDLGTLAWLRAAYGDDFGWTPVGPEALVLLHASDLPGPIKVAAMAQCLHDATGGRPVIVAPDPQE